MSKKDKIRKVFITGVALIGAYFLFRKIGQEKSEDEAFNADNPYIERDYQGEEKYGMSTTIYEKVVKPVFDKILSFVGLIVLSPFFVIVSLLVVLDDPGSVFFTQKRIGKDGAYFMLHKFRTMKMSTPHDVPTHMLQNPDQYITRVGKVLRRTSLDELPQIWDIFRGKMSVIGPRPALWNQGDLAEKRGIANTVLPGLTGLAQISGRDELQIERKAQLDKEYVKALRKNSFSGLMMDIRCFFGTVLSVLCHDGVVEGGTGALLRTPDKYQMKMSNGGLAQASSPQVKSEDKKKFPLRSGVPEIDPPTDWGHLKIFHIDVDHPVKVLITGSGSYIGEFFKDYAKEHYPNIRVDTVDMKGNDWKSVDFGAYDTIFHVAGIAHVDVGKADNAEVNRYYAVNTDLAIEVAKKAKASGVHQFIFMSSMIIYGGVENITVDTIPSPNNCYGDSKWQADKGIRALGEDNFKVVILRLPMVYGRGARGNYSSLVKIAKYLPFLPVTGNQRSMIYIENLAEFLAQLMLSKESGVFVPQNAKYSNTGELMALIAGTAGKKIRKSRALMPVIAIGAKVPGKVGSLIQKAFGNSCYDKEMSIYNGINYQRYSLEQSIYRMESNASSSPLVSVVMAIYNDQPKYIRESLESMVNQTYRNLEILIVDDSTDEATIAAVDEYAADPRVRLIRHGQRRGFVSSLNIGLKEARGALIARMDGDDVADIHRFEKQVAYMLANTRTDILGSQVDVIDENSRVTGHRAYPLGGFRLAAFFTMRTPVAHPSVIFRRAIVDAGYRYDESFRKAEDIDFWLRLYNAGYIFSNLPDTLVRFRVETDFMEKRVNNKMQENNVLMARRRNFTMRRPIFSMADWVMSYVRQFAPDSLKSQVYNKENGRHQ